MHTCNQSELFSDYESKSTIITGVTSSGTSSGVGRVRLSLALENGDLGLTLNLNETRYIPNYPVNLISQARLNDANIYYDNENWTLYHKDTRQVLAYVSRILNSYVFKLYRESEIAIRLIKNSDDTYQWSETAVYHTAKSLSLTKWHSRFGHLNISSLKKHLNHLNITYVNDITDLWYCDSCERFKATKLYNRSSQEWETEPYAMIHTDMVGPIKSEGLLKELYFFTFTNDKTRYTNVYTAISKNEWFDHLRTYENLTQTKTKLSRSIERIRTDFGTELRSHKVDRWLSDKDIVFEPSALHSQKENGVSERTGRTIMEIARSTILEGDIPDYLWTEIVLAMFHVKNLRPTRAFERLCPEGSRR